jgi:transposase
MSRYEITDEQWGFIEPLLPGREGDPGGRGADNRLFVNAVVWIARTGAPWRDLPARFGAWNSVFQRFNRWAKSGVWARVFQACQVPDLEALLLDSTIIRAHQHAAAPKKRGLKRSAARVAATAPKSTSRAMPADNPWKFGSAPAKSTT